MAEHNERVGLHTTRVGDQGPWVVFLHGLFGQGRNFTQIAKGLEPEMRSLLVDLPNHGRSPWTEGFDLVEHADAVAEELRRGVAADGPVHLVGHSLGGKIAMLLALRHPELVERLVVVDISPSGGGDTGEFAYLLDSLAELDLSVVQRRSDADVRLAPAIRSATVRGFLLQNLRADDDGGWRWQANLDLLRASLPTIGGFPGHDGAPFDGPVLWVAGERSDYVGDDDAPVMRALFPRTRQLTVKGAGHWVHSEAPEVFTEALRVFLRLG